MINEEIIEENLVVELEWLKEEFEILFKSKIKKFTKKDQKIANDVLDYILENTYVCDNIKLHNLLDEVIHNIEQLYPYLL